MGMSHTVGQLLERAAATTPNRQSVTLGDESRTFAESDARANRMTNVLLGLGLKRGDRLMFWSPISLWAFDIFFATQKIGVIFVPFKEVLSLDEGTPLVQYIDPALLVADAAMADRARALADAAGVRLCLIGATGPDDLATLFAAAGSHHPGIHVEDEDIHAIFLTSGSTGQPKGVMVSHRASWHRSYDGCARAQSCGGPGDINMFPLFHWAGWHFTLMAWAHLRPVHLTYRADAESLIELIDRWKPSHMYGLPAIWQRILDFDQPHETASLRVAMTGTYRFEPDLIERIRSRFPNALCTTGWGATEFGSGVMIYAEDIPHKPYSVGLPCPGVDLRIVDGELQGRSDQMMTGYYNLPDVTAATMVDGWYLTGDLAEQDADGYFFITGRRREIIRSGAEAIAPAEVEAAIVRHRAVHEVAVIGLPDAIWGEIVCAAIVLMPGETLPSVADLRAHLTPALAHFKHPRRVVQISELPRTPATGQIQRSQVREGVMLAQVAA